jgi:flagellar hook-associated protein 3 FlgL
MQVRPGSGAIGVSAAAGNTGTASLAAASISNAGQYDGGSYSVQFSGGQYQVLDGGNNVVASGAYTAGSTIQFRGLSLSFNGAPADGDKFSVSPASAQSLFSGLQNLINLVATPGTDGTQRAQNQTAMYGALQFLNDAQSHITDTLAGVGAREQAVSSSLSQLQSRSTQLQTTLSGLQDLDYAAATTEFSRDQVTLQAAQQSYIQIQGLSLFNYLK